MFYLTFFNANSQEVKNYWNTSNNNVLRKQANVLTPSKYKSFILDYNSLTNDLNALSSSKRGGNTQTTFMFPNTDGKIQEYRVKEASVMTEVLQAKYPNLRSYIGVNTNNPSDIIRFSTDTNGIKIMMMTPGKKPHYIEPESKKSERYILYSKESITDNRKFDCDLSEVKKYDFSKKTQKREALTDSKLYTFRIALACTGEYGTYHTRNMASNSTDAEKKLVVLQEYNILLTRVNGIYERDFSVRLLLADNVDEIIYFNSNTDPYTNDDSNALLTENKNNCNAVIGSNNYDVGHVVGVGGGGLASLNSVCASYKAQGMTSLNPPESDAFYVDYVAHELGHQFGGNHTFNNACGGNVSGTTSVEPGSGSTIMAYAGICSPNVQNNSDAYFHNISIQEVTYNLRNRFTCAESTDNGNSTPTISGLNSTYYIPTSTPFSLDVIANDTDGNSSLTYCWEQMDPEAGSMPPNSSSTKGPLFRSLNPKTQSNRYFPEINTVLAGNTSSQWEVLPSVARTMNFTITVRDNDDRGGQVSFEDTQVITVDTGNTFAVTSQNSSNEVWYAGSTANITWNVASTDIAPISCEFVDIYMTIGGRNGFDILVASSVPNTGQYITNVPEGIDSEKARIMVKGQDNVFFAVNSTNFAIVSKRDFLSNFDENTQNICSSNTAVFNFTYNNYEGFTEEVTFSTDNLPSGLTAVFSPSSAINDDTNVTITISGFDSIDNDFYLFNIISQASVNSKASTIIVNSYSNDIEPVNILNGSISEIDVTVPYQLRWEANEVTVDYYLQISDSNSFDNLLVDEKNTSQEYVISDLNIFDSEKTYYWRIKAENYCNAIYSEVYDFALAPATNITYTNNTSTNIPDNNTSNGLSSEIIITDSFQITDVNVTVNINHTYISDVKITLTSPAGEIIVLKDNGADNDNNNLTNTVFDDSGVDITTGTAPYTGTFKPFEKLSTFNSSNSKGTWTLYITDNYEDDTGSLLNWTIDLEGQEVESPTYFDMTFSEENKSICSGDEIIYTFVYHNYYGFSSRVDFSTENLPDGLTAVFSPISAAYNNTNVKVTVSGFDSIDRNIYNFDITSKYSSDTSKNNISTDARYRDLESTTILNQDISSVNIFLPYKLEWENDNNASQMFLEISTSENFDEIIFSQLNNTGKYTIDDINDFSPHIVSGQVYYWRIKAENDCNFIYSEIYDFEFAEFASSTATNEYTNRNGNIVTSEIIIDDLLKITDINVTLNINHSNIGDLKLELTGPHGENIVLREVSNDNGQSYTNTTFDDQGSELSTSQAPYTGSFVPYQALELFNKTKSKGIWTLTITDNGTSNSNDILTSWDLNVKGQIQLDFDQDDIADFEDDTLQAVAIRGFSPNGDDFNPYFTIGGINDQEKGNDIYPKVNVTIHNRQGVLVYQQNDYKNNWDGTYNGKTVPVGNYHIFIQSSSDKTSNVKTLIYIN